MTTHHRMTKLTIVGATALATILFMQDFSSRRGAIGVTPCFAQSGSAGTNVGAGVGINGNVSGDPSLTGNTRNTQGDPGLTGNTRSRVNSQGQIDGLSDGVGGNAGAGASSSLGTGGH